MQDVKVNYQLKQIPSNWEELKQNKKDFLFIVSLFFKDLTKQQLHNLAALKILDVSDISIRRINAVIENHPESRHAKYLSENLFRASELAGFITGTELSITENVFPKLKKYYAPKNVLNSFVAWEYALAESSFFSYAETNKEIFLDRLIAIIYRAKKPFYKIRRYSKSFDGDIRMSFNDHLVGKRMKKISKIPYHHKWLIFRWFSYQREMILKAHPYTFNSKRDENKKKQTDVGSIWIDTILALSQVGEEEKTANTKLSVILRRIENDNRNYAKLKQKNNE